MSQITVYEPNTEITITQPISQIILSSAGPQGPKGDTGATGPTGPKGDMGTFAPKGTWSSATTYSQYDVVTNRGKTWYALQTNTNQQPLFDGGNNWKLMAFGYNGTSAWVSGTFYYVGDTVTYSGSTYYCFVNVTTAGDRATNPADLSTSWLLIASKGDTGPTGPMGQAGSWGYYYQLTSDLVYSTSPGFGVGNDWSPFNTSSKTFGCELPVGLKYYTFQAEFKISGSSQATSHALSFAMVSNGVGSITNLDGTYALDRTTGDYKTSPPVSNNASYRRQVDTIGTYYTIEASVATNTALQYRRVLVNGFFQTNSTVSKHIITPSFRWVSAAETPTIYAGSYLNVVEIPGLTSNGTWA